MFTSPCYSTFWSKDSLGKGSLPWKKKGCHIPSIWTTQKKKTTICNLRWKKGMFCVSRRIIHVLNLALIVHLQFCHITRCKRRSYMMTYIPLESKIRDFYKDRWEMQDDYNTISLCLWWDKMLCEQDFYVKTCNP